MARHHERYSPDYEDHGIGDTARRNAEADYRDQFGKGRRTQNMPEDYGTTRTPEPFDRTSYRDEYGRYGERYGEERSRFPGRGWSSGYPGGDRPGWRGDAGMGRAYSGNYESPQRDEPRRYSEGGGQALARGYRGRGPKNYSRSDERIQEDISERLWDADDVDASDVTVEVKNGEVTLRGNVERRSIKHRIEDIADACSGVKDIHNEIRVQPRNEWPYGRGPAPGDDGNPATRREGDGQDQNTRRDQVEGRAARVL
ncbi:MAG: BON domain-containing protein, partial [Pseudomonadota bacterium]